jgi:orotate phosphoribosyltransferase
LKPHQSRFLDLALERNVLRFGEFSLKSGRTSPYFFNAGLFDSGAALATLGECYADALEQSGLGFDMLFGPAYKGIPLAAATSMALAAQSGRDTAYAFNRKEVKDHGEGGLIVGSPLAGRILIIDDVITAGTSVRESVQIIRDAGAEPAGVVIALDRQEQGQDGRSAVAEVTATFGIPVYSIVGLTDLVTFLDEQPELDAFAEAVRAYRARYGV